MFFHFSPLRMCHGSRDFSVWLVAIKHSVGKVVSPQKRCVNKGMRKCWAQNHSSYNFFFIQITIMWERVWRLEVPQCIALTFCMISLNLYSHIPTLHYLSFPALLFTPCVIYFDNVYISRKTKVFKSNLTLSSQLQVELSVMTNVEGLSDYKMPHLHERLLLYFEGFRLKEGD